MRESDSIKNSKKHLCPCCGYYEFSEGAGDFDICPICFWEDDPVQNENPEYVGGANRLSLNECKANYRKFGACEERFVSLVRKPTDSEMERTKKL